MKKLKLYVLHLTLICIITNTKYVSSWEEYFEYSNSENNIFNPRTPGYFNYDTEDKDHGPKSWHKIDEPTNEFKLWINKDNNQCDGDQQSPVHIKDESTCKEDHKINTRVRIEGEDFQVEGYLIIVNTLFPDKTERVTKL